MGPHRCHHPTPAPPGTRRLSLPPISARHPGVSGRADLQRLEKEREGLLRELRVVEGRANRQREQGQAGSLRALLRHQDQVEEQAAAERRTVAQLDQEIRSWEKRLAGLAKQAGSAGVSQRHKAQGQRRVRTLENQLDKAVARFNSQLALNTGLREELETLRIERGRFEHLYRRLERELQETRKAIGAMVDSSSSAFDARDEAQTKLGQLREKAEKDLAQHGAEMKELQRVLDHDRRLRHFLDIKVQERMFTQEALEAKRKREQEEAEGKHRDPREEMLESYEAAFKQIQQLTGEDDMDVLVEKFRAVEDENFAQFNYINEQNNELERLGERITQVRGCLAPTMALPPTDSPAPHTPQGTARHTHCPPSPTSILPPQKAL
ncbi:coiled-coil domain containing 114, partial [Chelydra serpentina]